MTTKAGTIVMAREGKAVSVTGTLPSVTVADARRTDWTADEAEQVAKAIAEVTGGIVKATADALWTGALVAEGLVRSGVVGTGKDAKYRSPNAYMMTCGFDESQASKVVTLARAAAMGVRKDSADAKVIAQVTQGRSGTKDSRAAVKDALRKGDADALSTALAAHKSAGTPAVTTGGDTGTDTGSRAPGGNADQTDTDTGPREVRPTPQDVIVALHALRPQVHALDSDGWSKVEDALTSFIADEIDRRRVLAQGPVKGEVVTTD